MFLDSQTVTTTTLFVKQRRHKTLGTFCRMYAWYAWLLHCCCRSVSAIAGNSLMLTMKPTSYPKATTVSKDLVRWLQIQWKTMSGWCSFITIQLTGVLVVYQSVVMSVWCINVFIQSQSMVMLTPNVVNMTPYSFKNGCVILVWFLRLDIYPCETFGPDKNRW